MKNKKTWVRVMAGGLAVLLLVGMVAGLSGCSVQEQTEVTPKPSESPAVAAEVLAAQKKAADERTAYLDNLKKTDVLADSGEFTEVDNLVLTYKDIPTEDLDAMVAFESAGTEERLPTYVFIGKMKEGAATTDIQQPLLDTAVAFKGMDGDGAEIETVSSNGYIIMAAAQNGSDIVNKFSLVIEQHKSADPRDLFGALRQNVDA